MCDASLSSKRYSLEVAVTVCSQLVPKSHRAKAALTLDLTLCPNTNLYSDPCLNHNPNTNPNSERLNPNEF